MENQEENDANATMSNSLEITDAEGKKDDVEDEGDGSQQRQQLQKAGSSAEEAGEVAEDEAAEDQQFLQYQIDDGFAEIPELPSGQLLRLELLSPWDDPKLIGLGGIELFNAQGERPPVDGIWTNAVERSGDLRALLLGADGILARESESRSEDDGIIIDNCGDGDQQQTGSGNGQQMWLCDYRQLPDDSAEPIHISVRFQEPQTLAMIRIWNYAGSSRVHALRGVRNLRLWLDQLCIFSGEICCAFAVGAPQGDTILFTTNDDILAKIAEHDEQLLLTNFESLREEEEGDQSMTACGSVDVLDTPKMLPDQQLALMSLQRAAGGGRSETTTMATRTGAGNAAAELSLLSRLAAPCRPTTGHSSKDSSSAVSSASSTAATGRPAAAAQGQNDGGGDEAVTAAAATASTTATTTVINTEVEEPVKEPAAGELAAAEVGAQAEDQVEEEEDENLCMAKLFHVELLANWGAPDCIGLTGIQFLGPGFEPLDEELTRECQVRCEPSEVGTVGQLNNLLNGRNLTCRPEDMCLLMKSGGSGGGGSWAQQQQQAATTTTSMPAPILSFTFPQEVRVSGISIWNYNASPELSYAGVRCARFYANGRPINGVGSVLLRKAPGFVFFDFVQDVLFDRCPLLPAATIPRPLTRSVAAFIFQLRLLSSWGDEFYIGLNGIELYNRRDQPIRLRPQNLAAFPESVNCLASVHADPRTSDKLIDGVNDTAKAHHMWLTPILPNSYARVFIIFDTPTFVTRIRIYNYRKTPERGVRHIALSADDLLLCSGAEVPMSGPRETRFLDITLRDSE